MSFRKRIPLLLALALIVVPFLVARAAGGQLSGTVFDPKGAVIVGASVTCVASADDKKFTATTDDEGRYKIDGLPPGVYLVTFKAEGFSEARREGVSLTKGQAAKLDIKLEVAPVEGLIPVVAGSAKANSDSPAPLTTR